MKDTEVKRLVYQDSEAFKEGIKVGKKEMIEGLVEEEVDLIPKFGKFNDNEPLDRPTMTTEFVKEHGLPCPDGYIFKDENGNVINATKIVLEKKKKEYPKTYEECCKVIGYALTGETIIGYKTSLLRSFQKLLICRDAYWKIAGDWEEKRKEKAMHYVICSTLLGEVIKDSMPNCIANYLFDFPTPEMRDAFKENFDTDLESCKEFL